MVMNNKNTHENNSKKFEKLEKYIEQEILNANKNVGNTCGCSNMNFVSISKNMNNIEVLDSKKK